MPDLRRDLQKLASETDIKHLPDNAQPNPSGLIGAVQKIQTAKRHLANGDKVFSEEEMDGEKVEINPFVTISPAELSNFAVKETISMPAAEMILAVKKPDYLGASKWEFRHGRRAIMARIEDLEFLSEFRHRKKEVRPGDALRCMVSIDMTYGFDNELIGETYVIHEVKEVLEDDYDQGDMF